MPTKKNKTAWRYYLKLTALIHSGFDRLAVLTNIHPVVLSVLPLIYVSYNSTNPKVIFSVYGIFLLVLLLLKFPPILSLFTSLLMSLWFQQGKFFIDAIWVSSISGNVRMPVTYFVSLSSFILFFLFLFFFKYRLSLKMRASLIDILAFIMIFLSILSVWFSDFSSIAWMGTAQFVQFIFLFWIIRFCIHKHPNSIKVFFDLSFLFVIIQGVHMIIQYIHKGPIGIPAESVQNWSKYGRTAFENAFIYRPAGIFDDPNLAGSLLGVMFPMFLVLIIAKRNIVSQKLLILGTIFSFIGIILSQSRVVWFITAFLSTCVLFFLRHRLPKKLPVVLTLLCAFGCLFFSTIIVPRLYSLETALGTEGSGLYRIKQFQLASTIMSLRPLGIGANTYPYYVVKHFNEERYYYNPAEPHSIFFQIGCELGIGVLLFFILFILSVLYRSIQVVIQTKNMLVLALLFGFVASLCIGGFYPWLFQLNFTSLLWILAALLTYDQNK